MGIFLLLRDTLSGLCFQSLFSGKKHRIINYLWLQQLRQGWNDHSVSSASELKGHRAGLQVMQCPGQGWSAGGRCQQPSAILASGKWWYPRRRWGRSRGRNHSTPWPWSFSGETGFWGSVVGRVVKRSFGASLLRCSAVGGSFRQSWWPTGRVNWLLPLNRKEMFQSLVLLNLQQSWFHMYTVLSKVCAGMGRDAEECVWRDRSLHMHYWQDSPCLQGPALVSGGAYWESIPLEQIWEIPS